MPMARTRQTARKSTRGRAPRPQKIRGSSRPSFGTPIQEAVSAAKEAKGLSKTSQRELSPLPDVLPEVPAPPSEFLKHVAANPDTPVRELMKPYLAYEKAIRGYLAQDPEHEFVSDNTVGLLSVYEDGNKPGLAVRARNLEAETQEENDKYIMPLKPEDRKKSGEMTIVEDLAKFRDNFSVFTEGALQNLDWSNIIVAGSAVLTPLLTVPEEHGKSKRTLREWYHEKLAPASDIDLFIYGIDNEADALEKMAQIEKTVQDNLLWETVTIRTRNTITIVSQYPNRHIQIVLRLYKSISQILTGFDVDCSCFAYDGQRILANPRAITACITQCNDIDLSRRSPSYENRLAKYAKRGFEIYCPFLDRSRIDPTIFERSFNRTVGLAKLLVIEALPTPEQRDAYQKRRRQEMGRPELANKYDTRDHRNKKEMNKEEVAEWDFFDDISSYQRFTIPYGKGLNAKNIERLFYKKDMVLNGEWNKMNHPPHRTVNLHRHPVFFGDLRDVIKDCCGYCPEPVTDEEIKVAEEEDKTYVKGKISLLTYLEDDPGRQEVGSFNPLGPEDYTEMAYVGETEKLCNAIVKNDVEAVRQWCQALPDDESGKTAINQRDICGRTPLHLACLSESTSVEVAQILLDHGAKLVARVQDGRTALHFAAAKGDAELVRALLRKSAANEEEKELREGGRDAKKVRIVAESVGPSQVSQNDEDDEEMRDIEEGEEGEEDEEMIDEEEGNDEGDGEEEESENVASGGEESSAFESIHRSDAASTKRARTEVTEDFVKVPAPGEEETAMEDNAEEEDDIIDINVEDWDNNMSPLHHAIIAGQGHIVEVLVSEFGADIRRPIKKIGTDWRNKRVAQSALLSLVFAMYLHGEEIIKMVETMINLGASTAQATKLDRITAFHYFATHGGIDLLDKIFELDGPAAQSVINFAVNESAGKGYTTQCVSPLVSALIESKTAEKARFLLEKGASATITLADTLKYLRPAEKQKLKHINSDIQLIKNVMQPLERAILHMHETELISKIIEKGAAVNQPMQYHFVHGSARYGNYYFGDDNHADSRRWPSEDVYTLLDFVRHEAKDIRKKLKWKVFDSKKPWIHRDRQCLVPDPLEPLDKSVLDKYTEDDYVHFTAKRYLETTNSNVESINRYIKEDNEYNYAARLEKWKEARKVDLVYFESVEKLLLQHDAKTYRELHPELYIEEGKEQEQARIVEEESNQYVQSYQNYYRYSDYESTVRKLNDPEPSFFYTSPHLGEGDENKDKGYKKLYEAVWRGNTEDLETVKQLCLGPSAIGEDKIPALLIATDDMNSLTPFAIAVIRGNFEMMDLILEIAEKQYAKPEEKPYETSSDDDSDIDSEESDLEMDVGGPSGEGITDEDFAVEDANAAPTEVKSSVSPYAMLKQSFRASYFVTDEENDAIAEFLVNCNSPMQWDASFITWAIFKNDLKLLQKIFALGKKYKPTLDNETSPVLAPIDLCNLPGEFKGFTNSPTVRLAIQLGRIEILEELMRETSFAVFYEDIEEELNDEEKKAHAMKYYQGLTVRGQRQKDWADAAVPAKNALKSARYVKPYQIALVSSCKESAEWLKSERPWVGLMEFMRLNEGTKEVRWLRKQGDKLESWMNTWLGTKTNMEAHLIVRGWNSRSEAFLRERVAANPEFLNTTNDQFITPALYAIQHGKRPAAKVLLNLGADFSARDRSGKNLLHMLLDRDTELKDLEEWFKIIPPPIILACLTEKNKRVSRTPLSHYLETCLTQYSSGPRLAILNRLLELSGGAELGIANAEGNYPIHIAVLHASIGAIRLFAKLRPDILFWENANGRTPIEIARARHLRNIMQDTSKITIKTRVDRTDFNKDKNIVHSEPDSTTKELSEKDKKEQKDNERDFPDNNKVWTVTQELIKGVGASSDELPDAGAEKTGIRRKLVSLLEASLLARRLKDGEIKISTSYYYNTIEFDQGEEWTDASILSLWD